MGGNVPVNMGNFSTFNKWEGNNTGKGLVFHLMQVDDNYLDLMGLEIVSGRPFYRGTFTNEIIINQAAARQMSMAEPVGRKIDKNGSFGEVRDQVKKIAKRKPLSHSYL